MHLISSRLMSRSYLSSLVIPFFNFVNDLQELAGL